MCLHSAGLDFVRESFATEKDLRVMTSFGLSAFVSKRKC